MGKRILSLCVAFVLCVFILPFPTLAEGEDDLLATLQAASDRGDDYPANYKEPAKDAVVDRWNFYNRECTSFVAWCMESRNGVFLHNWYVTVDGITHNISNTVQDSINEYGKKLAHAKYWGTAFQSMGFAVNSSPAVGSIAWSNAGDYGHVAWVSAVNGGNVTIEEYNYSLSNPGRFGTRTVVASSFTGFIHVKDIGPKPLVGPTLTFHRANPGGQAVFSWTVSEGANHYSLKIFRDKYWEGELIYSADFTGTECSVDLSEGYYEAYVDAVNGEQVQMGNVVPVSIDLVGPKLTVHRANPEGRTVFNWTTSERANHYSLKIFRDKYWEGELVHSADFTGTECGVPLPEGYYEAYVDAVNGEQVQMGNVVSFTITDREMKTGYERTIPDGDYEIVCAANPNYALDISGNIVPAVNGTNVNLWERGSTPREQDVFTVTYLNNGFYKIVQKGTNASLDIAWASIDDAANLWIYGYGEDNIAQQWAITTASIEGVQKAYRIQAKCSGASVDIANGIIENGSNIWQYGNNDTVAQGWLFIPYQPEQSLPNGRYVLLTAVDNSYELDVEGNSGDIPNFTNIQIWDDTCDSRYNSFDVTSLDNGYYELIHVASGKALEVSHAGSVFGQNIALHDWNGTDAQQWAITRNSEGYILRARCSGLAMDLDGAKGVNGANVTQWAYRGVKHQAWTFVPAEYTIRYNSDGGSDAPASQTKYYKETLTLSNSALSRTGYTFLGWSTDATATSATFQPGDSFTLDQDTTLYAVWKDIPKTTEIISISHTITEISAVISCWDSDATVFCGVYNNSGKMIAVRSVQATSESNYQFQFDGQQFDYAKVFIVDSNFCPLCEAKRT